MCVVSGLLNVSQEAPLRSSWLIVLMVRRQVQSGLAVVQDTLGWFLQFHGQRLPVPALWQMHPHLVQLHYASCCQEVFCWPQWVSAHGSACEHARLGNGVVIICKQADNLECPIQLVVISVIIQPIEVKQHSPLSLLNTLPLLPDG